MESQILKKILTKQLKKEFSYIEDIIDLVLINSIFYAELKLKIILDSNWVKKNVDVEALEYINDEIEVHGHALLSPFTAQAYSNEKINMDDVDELIFDILKVLNIKTKNLSLTVSYIIF